MLFKGKKTIIFVSNKYKIINNLKKYNIQNEEDEVKLNK